MIGEKNGAPAPAGGVVVVSIAALAVIALQSSPVAAQSSSNSAAAQALFEEARKLMAAGKTAEACPKLEESQRLDPGTGTLLNLAQCYERTGKLASAWNKYLEAAASAKASGNKAREKEARKRSDALRPRLATLAITLEANAQATPGVEVTRNGELVGHAQWGLPIPADAGEHAIEVRAPGYVPYRTNVTVTREAEAVAVSVPALAREAPPPAVAPAVTAARAPVAAPASEDSDVAKRRRTQRTLAVVAGGVGLIGLGVGTGFGLKSKSHHDEAEKYCDGSRCSDARGVSAGEDAHAAGNVSTVAMTLGVLGVAGGVTLWLLAPNDPSSGTRLGVGPGRVQLEGAFR